MIERYCDICGKKMNDDHIRFRVSVIWDGPNGLFCDMDTQNVWPDVCRTCAGDIVKDISDLSVKKQTMRGYNGIEEVKEESSGNELRKTIRDARPGGRN